MKTTILSTIVCATIFLSTNAMAQDSWKCRNASGEPACFVTNVQMRNGVYQSSGIQSGSKYMFVEYIDTSGNAGSFQMKVANYYVSIDSLRATEALALTALTTGLPIAWYGTDNSAWFLSIGKPGAEIQQDTIPWNY